MRKGFCTALAFAALVSTSSFVQAQSLPQHEGQRKQASQAFESSDWQTVIDITGEVLKANPKDPLALHLRGSSQIEFGIAMTDAVMIRAGIADSREAITVAGQDAEFNYYLPYLYGMTSLANLEDQSTHAEVAIQIAGQLLSHPKITAEQKANTYYQRGLANSAMQDATAAVKDFRAAIALNPKHMASYLAIPDAYAAADQAEFAIAAYAEAIKAFPDEPLVHNNQGMYYQKIGRPNDALRSFTSAVQKNPQYFIAITNRGYTWLEGGKPAEAERDFTASLQVNANQPAVYGMRGTSRLVQGNWQAALEDYNMVLRVHPNDPIAHADAGFARFFGRDYAGALAEFNKVAEAGGSARFIDPWRVWTLVRLGRSAEAAGIALSSRQKSEKERDWIDHVILFHVGEISGDDLINRVDRTDAKIQTAQLCEARFFVAEHHLRRGKQQEAATAYQQALATGQKELSAFRGASYALQNFQ
ncbi:MAG: tetratricopeptide repeat protein [Planctomycetota bacterium]|nr:tetratricopeptide repeat protein [Planctomycetota bacterium]